MRAIICKDTGELCNDYKEYLQTRHWKSFRYNYLQEHKKICVFCLKETDYVELHHLHYENLGREKDEDVVLLCYKCHRLLHKELDCKEIKKSLNILKEYV